MKLFVIFAQLVMIIALIVSTVNNVRLSRENAELGKRYFVTSMNDAVEINNLKAKIQDLSKPVPPPFPVPDDEKELDHFKIINWSYQGAERRMVIQLDETKHIYVLHWNVDEQTGMVEEK